MKSKKIGIIGAGIAGLACAVRLRVAGFDVDVYEANEYPGGKLTEIREGEFRFDAGPSLFTMPQFVDELFQLAGVDSKTYFDYIRKEVVCQYFYEDGTKFTAFGDKDKYAKECEKTFGIAEENILNYFASSQSKYDLTASLFLEKSLHKLGTYLSTDTIKAILNLKKLDIFSTLDDVNKKHFSDPRLQQLFNRYATYNGSSPYQTPGIMSMIPHLEQHFGTFYPRGGMISITNSIYQLGVDLGVRYHFGKKVESILVSSGKANGLMVGGVNYPYDKIISNMDIVPTYSHLLKGAKAPEKTLGQERSSSALIFYWGIKGEFKELDLHNIFFSQDYRAEFQTIFHKNSVADDITVYVNITSKQEKEDAQPGHENWFVMVNVPGNKDQDWEEIIARTRRNIIAKLSKILEVELRDLIVSESILDPRTIESKTHSFQGSLYGAASNDRFAAFLRHPNFSNRIKNLYFCGGSVHPGGGIPLCLLSAKITAEMID